MTCLCVADVRLQSSTTAVGPGTPTTIRQPTLMGNVLIRLRKKKMYIYIYIV